MNSFFITFEGIDGAGKSTHINFVEKYLQDNHIPFISTREPGGTPLGEKSEENDANDDSSDNDKTSETQSELSNLDFLLGTMNRNQDEDNDSS